MKITVFLLFLALMQASAEGYSQQITYKGKNITLKQVFNEINKQTGYNVFWSSGLIAKAPRIDVDFVGAPISEVLETCLKEAHLTFNIEGTSIIIKASPPAAVPEEEVAPPDITITGTVRDAKGAVMAGVSIVVVDSKDEGTVTDNNGKFVLDVKAGAVIKVSFVGYDPQTFTVTPGKNVFSIILQQDVKLGDEIVITAYGKKEKKEAIVGSVSTVDPTKLKVPASNLTTALAGQIAGVISFQRAGQPGADNAQFFVRGVTTLGYSASPLILVDNIELTANDLARLQVDDIASFSILKDASASALYGARGANGVILVTTKEGKAGKARVNIRLESSVSSPTKNIQLADPITYMKGYNEAIVTRDPHNAPYYTPNDIERRQATLNHAPGSNPFVYPAVDWMSMLFKGHTPTQRGNFSVQGGSDVTRYYIAGSYSKDNGILQVNPVNNFNSGMKFENYQLRSNVNVKITKTTEAVVRLWGNFNDYSGPITSDGSGLATDLYSRVLHTSPVDFPAYYLPDAANIKAKHILFGNSRSAISGGLLDNPYADLMYGYKSFSESRMSAQFELSQDFRFVTPGLSFHGLFSTNRYSYFDLTRAYKPFYYDVQNYDLASNSYTLKWLNNNPGDAQEYLGYSEGPKNVYTYVYMQGTLDYNRGFGRHNVSASLVGTRQQTLYGNAGSLLASLPYRNLGLAGRLSYNYGSKYFIEGNFGYNGSERFAKDHRWGFFPTIGAGWVVSNEKFWYGDISHFITRLKLRGSIGLVGNDNIGSQRFFYLSSVSPNGGGGASFGTNNGFSLNGTTISAYPNPDVTWETARKTNLAAEVTLFKNLNIIAEIYHEYRYHILIRRGYIPVAIGIENSASGNLQANLGTAFSDGLDLHVDYKQRISKDLQASVLGNLTVTRNRVGHLEEPEYRYAYRYSTGKPINQQFGFVAERLFVDDKEAQNAPTQLFGGTTLPMGGDIKYHDINKDGVINDDDKVPIGLPTTPQIIYGFGFSVTFKQFDLSTFFQGLARESFFIDPNATAPFVGSAQLLKAYADNHWSQANQNLFALWPRYSLQTVNNNAQQSSWWLRDGSFLRLKSVEAGYTLPRRWTKVLYLDNARIYFSGLNLLTFTHFGLWDPEQSGNGFAYPIQKVVNVGVNLNF